VAVEAGADEGVGVVRGARDRREVDVWIVRDLEPVDVPPAAGEQRLEAAHPQKDLVALGAHARLQRGVVGVPNSLLALGEEATILRTEIDAARAHAPLGAACVEDADAASRDHEVELVVGDVVANVGREHEHRLALRMEHHAPSVVGIVVAGAREGDVEARPAGTARIRARRSSKGVGNQRVGRVRGRHLVDACVRGSARVASAGRLSRRAVRRQGDTVDAALARWLEEWRHV